VLAWCLAAVVLGSSLEPQWPTLENPDVVMAVAPVAVPGTPEFPAVPAVVAVPGTPEYEAVPPVVVPAVPFVPSAAVLPEAGPAVAPQTPTPAGEIRRGFGHIFARTNFGGTESASYGAWIRQEPTRRGGGYRSYFWEGVNITPDRHYLVDPEEEQYGPNHHRSNGHRSKFEILGVFIFWDVS